MATYVALIRGIAPSNPNMTNVKLREQFEKLGFENVQSVISSGNIIFDSPNSSTNQLEAKIETALRNNLGITGATLVRSQVELANLIKADPYKGVNHSQSTYLLVTFFKRPTKIPFKLPFQPEGKAYKLVASHDRCVCSVTDVSNAKTPDLMAWLERQFGKDISSRTWLTVTRILKKMDTQ